MITPETGETGVREGELLRHDDGPVTAVIRQAPRPGMARELERWMEGIGGAASGFPGFLGRKVIHPTGPASADYVVIMWFEHLADLEHWVISPERASWIARGEGLVVGGFHFQNVSGLGSLFLTAHQRAAGVSAPPRWKMAVVLLAILYPLVLALRYVIDWLLPGWGVPERVFLSVMTSVAVCTFAALPLACRGLAGWLYRGGGGGGGG